MKLAAIRYAAEQGATVDALLANFVRSPAADGVRLCGAVQHNLNTGDRRCDGMLLEELASGERFMICETVNSEMDTCRIDETALATVAERTMAALADGCDFLVINKFGKREVEGRGFAPAVRRALSLGVPALVGVNDRNAEDWKTFAMGQSAILAPAHESVWDWCVAHGAVLNPREAAV